MASPRPRSAKRKPARRLAGPSSADRPTAQLAPCWEIPQPWSQLNAVMADVDRHVRRAVEVSHAALDAAHVRHLLSGRLAARAYGLDCPVHDVSYVVFAEAHVARGGVMYLRPGVPVAVGTLPIVYLKVGPEFSASLLLEEPALGPMPRVLPLAYLVIAMLRPGPHQDMPAARGLLANGADAVRIRPLVQGVAPELLDKFDRIVAAAPLSVMR